MTALKTLKDFAGYKLIVGKHELIFKNTALYFQLRQEAIKWMKQDIEVYRTAELPLPRGAPGRKIHNFIVSQRSKWKEFFNISGSDLK